MEIDLILVKGKKQPEAVFTCLGARKSTTIALPGVARSQRAHAGGVPPQQWDEAGSLIDRCRKLSNGSAHGLYDMYVERHRSRTAPRRRGRLDRRLRGEIEVAGEPASPSPPVHAGLRAPADNNRAPRQEAGRSRSWTSTRVNSASLDTWPKGSGR